MLATSSNKNAMKINGEITFVLILLMLSMSSFGQTKKRSEIPPDWTSVVPKSKNPTFYYYVAKGIGDSETKARTDALLDAVKEAQFSVGLGTSSEDVFEAFQSGKDFNVVASDYKIPMRQSCFFSEQKDDKWYYYLLVQIAKDGNHKPEFVQFQGDCSDNKKNWKQYLKDGGARKSKKKGAEIQKKM